VLIVSVVERTQLLAHFLTSKEAMALLFDAADGKDTDEQGLSARGGGDVRSEGRNCCVL